MNSLKRISKVFESAEEVAFDDRSKIVIMSDCHRGDGTWADTFAKNQNLFFAALTQYYSKNYTYIELGDGDELWENKKLYDIINMHKDAFWLMSRFYKSGRLYYIYGNHDIVKQSKDYVKNNVDNFYDTREEKVIALFPDIKINEGLILKHIDTKERIFLLHGHQADFFNDTLWPLSRFLVRHVWKILELTGVNDPTSAAKNYNKKKRVERKLIHWTKKEKKMLIAGHTHRPVFPETGEVPYFNSGSCVHPRCITAIEITFGNIQLVKWSYKTKPDGEVFVGRDLIVGPRSLKNYLGTH